MSGIGLIQLRPTRTARRTGLYAIAGAAFLGGSGCTTLGGNVSGDFACRAPGGSCAPMSAIDARAVETVLGAADADPDRGSSAKPRLLPSQTVAGVVGRTGERTLRVVFPAHVDRAGVLHDEATAHVVVEDAAWTIASPATANRTVAGATRVAPDFEISRSPAPSSLREAIAGASAPATEGLESSPAQAPHPIIGVDAPLRPGAVSGPTSEALAAARAGRRIARPGSVDLSRVPPSGASSPSAGGVEQSDRTPTIAAPSTGSAGATAAGRVRALAKPAIDKLGERPSEPDLDNLFAPAIRPKDAPR